MKINPATIFGVGVTGVGVLLLLFSLTRGGETATLGGVTQNSGTGFTLIAVGVIVSGLIITATGQLIRRSPKPTDKL
jgi:cyanate permease